MTSIVSSYIILWFNTYLLNAFVVGAAHQGGHIGINMLDMILAIRPSRQKWINTRLSANCSQVFYLVHCCIFMIW